MLFFLMCALLVKYATINPFLCILTVCWRVWLSTQTLFKTLDRHVSLCKSSCRKVSRGMIVNTWCVSIYSCRPRPVCVKSSHSAVPHVSLHSPLHLLCFLILKRIWPSTSPPSFPSRFSYSPVTLISMCPEQYEWVSVPPAAPRLHTGMPFFKKIKLHIHSPPLRISSHRH